IDLPRLAQVVEDAVAQLLVDGADGAPRRHGEGADALDHLALPLLGLLPPDMQRRREGVGLELRRRHVDEAVLGERRLSGRDGREGVGLGRQAGNEDFHVEVRSVSESCCSASYVSWPAARKAMAWTAITSSPTGTARATQTIGKPRVSAVFPAARAR